MHPSETPEDGALIEGLESCRLHDGRFGHRDHVRAAWVYLRRHGLSEGAARLIASVKRFALAKGATGLYHETITWAFLVVINERIGDLGARHGWADFAARNQDLLDRGIAFLDRFYEPGTLHSARARRVFVLPDRRARTHRAAGAYEVAS